MLKAEFSRCFSCVYIYFILSSTNIAPYVFVLIVFIRRSHLFYTGFLINVDFTFTNALNIMFVRSCLPQMRYGPCFNIKMSSCQYRNFHCEVKTVVRLSFHHNNISFTGKMASLYWIISLVHAMWDKMGATWRKRFHSNIILDQMALQWRLNQCDCVSNHWRLDFYSTVCQSSTSLAFVWGIHRSPVNSPHKGPVTRKIFPFDDIIIEAHLSIVRYGANGMFSILTFEIIQ